MRCPFHTWHPSFVNSLGLVFWLNIWSYWLAVSLGLLTSPQFSHFLNNATFLPLGLRSSYASQHSQLGQDLRSAVSPELHITPIYEGRTYYSPVYRSPNHGTVELQGSQTALYRTGSGGHWLKSHQSGCQESCCGSRSINSKTKVHFLTYFRWYLFTLVQSNQWIEWLCCEFTNKCMEL